MQQLTTRNVLSQADSLVNRGAGRDRTDDLSDYESAALTS